MSAGRHIILATTYRIKCARAHFKRENRTSGSMRGCRKRATSRRACALLYQSPRLLTGRRSSCCGAVLELGRWHISQRRVQPCLIVNAFQELADTGTSIVEVAIFVAIDLLVLQGLHEGFTGS